MSNPGSAADLADIWNGLAANPPSPGELVSMPCLPADPGSPLAAGLLHTPAGELRRVLLLGLPLRLQTRVTANHQHASLNLELLPDPDDPASVFQLALILTDERFTDIFAILAADIVEAVSIACDGVSRLRAFTDQLTRWRDLFSAFSPVGLSGPARQGLFGELHLIRELLADGLSPDLVINAWTGPLHDPQDFHFGRNAVEVKTSSGSAQSFQVSGASQLDDSAFEHLFLLHLYLEVTENAGETLPQIVQHLVAQIESDPAALKIFEMRLHQAGYFHAQAERYHAEGFRVRHMMVAQVHEAFPRIRAADLPPGLGSVSYTVGTDQLLPYLVPFSTLTSALDSHV